MDTSRSLQKVEEFKINKKKRRKTIVYTKEFSFSAKKVFEQLCPLKEYDWIDGWECEIISSNNGYAQKDCVFTTLGGANLGTGVWTFTKYEPNKVIELLIINEIVIEQTLIELKENVDGMTTGTWSMKYTALNEKGNSFIDSMPDNSKELEVALEGLEYFLKHGRLLKNI